jgi:hypothetical protein
MAAIAEAVASTFVAECIGGKKPRAQGSGAASASRTLSRYSMTTPSMGVINYACLLYQLVLRILAKRTH